MNLRYLDKSLRLKEEPVRRLVTLKNLVNEGSCTFGWLFKGK